MADPNVSRRPRDPLAVARRRAGVTSVPWNEKNRDAAIALVETLYAGTDVADPAYFKWEYEQNPDGPAVVRLAVTPTGVVAGRYAVIPRRFQIDGEPVLGTLSVGTVTHADYRGKGLFMLLAEDVFADCRIINAQFTLGFPNPKSNRGFLKHLKFSDMGPLPLWVLPANLSVLADSRPARSHPILRAVLKGAHPFWTLLLNVRRRRWTVTRVAVEKVDRIDETFNDLWARSRGTSNAVIRDQAYLTWRFIDHPTRRYQVWTARAEGRLVGYLVSRVVDIEGIRCGMVVDLLSEPSALGDASLRDLLGAATRFMVDQQVAIVGSLMMKNTSAARMLGRAGFRKCPQALLPQGFPVIVRWHGPEPMPESLNRLSSWYLTMGDYDAV